MSIDPKNSSAMKSTSILANAILTCLTKHRFIASQRCPETGWTKFSGVRVGGLTLMEKFPRALSGRLPRSHSKSFLACSTVFGDLKGLLLGHTMMMRCPNGERPSSRAGQRDSVAGEWAIICGLDLDSELYYKKPGWRFDANGVDARSMRKLPLYHVYNIDSFCNCTIL